jgi:phosphatidylglycerol:prolipoprotein diacylglycerol transferase
MHPTLFRIPIPWHESLKCSAYIPVPAYGVMLMTGFLLAVWLARRRAAALGLEKVEIFDMGIFAIIGGVLGARLFHVVIYWSNYVHGLPEAGPVRTALIVLGRIAATWNGGLVFYGGLLGGMLALWIFARRRKIPLIDIFDFAAAPVAVGLAVTRIGCFLNGCCYGHPTSLPWGVRFPVESVVEQDQAAHGLIAPGEPPLPVVPAQLYETAAALTMAALIWWLVWPRRKFAGQAAFAFGLMYSVWRFANEFFRGDTFAGGPSLVSLTVFQYISIGLILAFGAAYLAARRQRRAPFVPPPPDAAGG